MCNTVVLSADCGPQVDRWYAQSQTLLTKQRPQAVSSMSSYEHYVNTYRGRDWVFDLKLRHWVLLEVPGSCPREEVDRPGVVRISIGMGTTLEHVRRLVAFLVS